MFLWQIAVLNSTLIDGKWINYETNLSYGEYETLNFSLMDLRIGKRYEVRVSWPSISPVKVYFNTTDSIDISDEKIVFIPRNRNSNLLIGIEATGVSYKSGIKYIVPLNVSLDQQYLFLTWSTWRLIFYLFPVLLVSCIITWRYFPEA